MTATQPAPGAGPLLAQDTLARYRPLGAHGRTVLSAAPQLRAGIRRQLQEEDAACLAIPQVNGSGTGVDWYAPFPGPVVPWSAMSAEERAAAKAEIDQRRARLQAHAAALLARQPRGDAEVFASMLPHVLEFPDDNHIHLVAGRPVVTFWGFQPLAGSVAPELPVLPTDPPGVAVPIATGQTGLLVDRPRRPWWHWLLGLLGLLLALVLLSWLLRSCGVPGVPSVPIPGLPDLSAPRSPDLPAIPVVPGGSGPVVPGVAVPGVAVPGGTVPGMAAPGAPNPGASMPGVTPPSLPGGNEAGTPPDTPPQPAAPPSGDMPAGPPPTLPDPAGTPPMPGTPPAPGVPPTPETPLRIPEQAQRDGSVDFLNGHWRSRTSLMDSLSGRPLEVTYDFQDGKGTVTVHRSDGTQCKGPMAARMAGGALLLDQTAVADCGDGQVFEPSTVQCRPGADGTAACQGAHGSGAQFQVQVVK
ncbi:SrfA family protein [Oleisolibacter albus]|uniref:SrfA family protein n=1 Tax=Oleisolibacter albus TaxID=2171757 RepID=UPI000DF21922|nr:SrfA family protein [Oleisolibacter albus]